MIAFIGDIHGEFWVLNKLSRKVPADVPFVQVGDLGYWSELGPAWSHAKVERQILFIDGNHDDSLALSKLTEPTEVWHNALFVPRGTVIHIGGKKVLFLGGSTSVDRHHRKPGNTGKKPVINAWFKEEDLTQEEADRAVENAKKEGGVDVMVTHTPPISLCVLYFSRIPRPPFYAGWRPFHSFPTEEGDVSACRVQEVWDTLERPPLFCGHMHRGLVYETARILDINELYLWKGE